MRQMCSVEVRVSDQNFELFFIYAVSHGVLTHYVCVCVCVCVCVYIYISCVVTVLL